MHFFSRQFLAFGFSLLLAIPAWANLPGGGTGTGSNVTITDNGSTVTLANGIVSIVITKTSAEIHTINYTYNNTGAAVTTPLLSGGNNGGLLYWFQNGGTFIAGPFTESVVANNGNYAEISLSYASPSNGIMDIHYSMLRGSPGFYTTAILTHRSQDAVIHIELRPNIYAGSLFNWMSVDAARNRLMQVTGGSTVGVNGAPVECSLWTSGIYAGQYEDKYKYTANVATLGAWGWSSVGTGGKNVGLWNVTASPEYYPGGPLERSLMEHIGTTILNVFTGGYYGLANDDSFLDGELWSKVYGPYFYYCNNVTNTLTTTNLAAQALYNDALAQATAEQTAWPYSWFTNANYTQASGRGTVTGKMVIADSGNPNASATGLWVGVVQQPAIDNSHDFQQWAKPYQFWVKTDTNGNFAIPDVIAGTNYTLHAFGAGAADNFMSQPQTGGGPPLLYDVPASPFSVTVTGGTTNSLGTVTWTPARVGATVFEIGYPDRTAAKFRHGDDYWVGEIGPSATAPSPIWSKWLEYPFDFPNGVNYSVGQSRWSTDWNFVQPVVTDSQGNYNTSFSTITFNLATAPTNGAQASLYIGIASDYYTAIVVTVNGNNLGSVGGVTGTPNNSIPTTGYYVGYNGSDTTIREGNNGAFSDERLTFPASQLHAGVNTITVGIRQIGGSYFANHAMYDYLRLELTGYVPPPPANVAAYAGNNANLVCWPVTPGATSYNILRSTVSGSGYASITNGVTGPVCGSGFNNATYLDTTAANGTTYYYVVRSVNPTGSSTNSPQSSGVIPSAGIAISAPAAPTGLSVGGTGHQSVVLNWNASSGANFYSIWRSTLVNTGGGSSNTLSTIVLNNATTSTSYTDASPTDGSIYKYFVTATSAGGTSGNSISAIGVALPTAPASKPVSLTANFYQSTNIVLNWNAVPGAIGYIIKRATSPAGPFTFLQSVTETVYYDIGLNASSTYYYQVIAVNAGGVSLTSTNSANGLQPAPTGLSAVGDDAQIVLSWSVTAGATSYALKRATSAGSENVTVISGYAGLTYTNTGLVNETTYYYVVTATGTGGTSGSSAEASATASAASSGTWTVDADSNWNTAANWTGGLIAFGPGNTADFSTISLTTNRTVTLDSARTISGLTFGDASSSFNWVLIGSNILTLATSPNINVVNQSATISTVIAGSAGLTKTGLGTLVLGGVTETFTNGLAVNAGKLILDFSATSLPATNLISATNALTLGGGTLQINGGTNAPSSQTFTATTLNSGGSGISAAPVSGANLPSVALGSLPTAPPPGATLQFSGTATTNSAGNVAATANLVTTTAGAGASGGINAFGLGKNGYFATVGLYDWAATTGAGPITIVGGSQVPGFYQTTGVTTGGNYDVNSSGVNSIGNAGGAASVRFNQNAALAINNGTFTWQNCQGILVTPKCNANNQALTGNTLEFFRSSSGGNSYGVIWQNNTLGYLNVSLVLGAGRQAGQDNGLVQAGPSTVVYSGVNLYGLNTYLNGGFSVVTADSGFGAVASASPVVLNGGTVVGKAVFAMDNGGGANARPVILGASGGGLAATAGNTMTIDGVVSGSGPLLVGIPASGANGNAAGLLPGSGLGTANLTPVYATGTVTLSNYNTFTGDISVNTGTLGVNLNNNFNGPTTGPLGNTAVARRINVNNGGTLNFISGNALGSTITTVGAVLIVNSGGTVTNSANDIETLGPVQLNGGILNGGGGAAPAFQMYDLRGTVTVGGNSPSTIAGPGNANSGYHLAAPTVFNVADVTGDTNSDLNVTGILVDQDGAGTAVGHLGAAGSLTKTGAGTLTLSGTNAYTGGTALNAGILTINAAETAGVSGPLGKSGTVIFGGGTLQYSAANQNDYSARFSTATNQFINIDTAGQSVTFANSLTSSGGTLTKLGTGTLTLTGPNTYNSGSFINSGTLAVNNTSGSGTGSGNVTVSNGGTLTGNGVIGGFITVSAGGKLMPGNPFGVLTVSNNLSLASGSTTYFQVQHSPLTNSALKVSGTLTADGTLTVTNSGAAAFTAGDSFKLLTGTIYAGAFSSFNLPALNSGLFWSTSRLATDGTLGVVSTNPPTIRDLGLSGSNLVLQGTNGTPNWPYTVLSTTNLALPLAQWTPIITNSFNASGSFTWTNATGANGLQQFFVIEVQ